MKSEKVGVFGARGFIGRHLCQELENYIATDIDDCDISKDFKQVEAIVRECDIIVPLAAVAVPKIYFEDPEAVWDVNLEANKRIIDLVKKYGKRVVFPSSSEVYSVALKSGENDPIIRPNVHEKRWIYACAKEMLDRYIMSIGVNAVIFRPFNFVGAGMDDQRQDKRLIPSIVESIKNNQPIKIIAPGHQTRRFTWIGDGIEAIKLLMFSDVQGVYNIANPYNLHSVEEVVSMFSERTGYKNIEYVSEEEMYGDYSTMIISRSPSIDKIQKFGWEPKTPMKKIADKICEAEGLQVL